MKTSSTTLVVAVTLFILFCCLCLACFAFGLFVYFAAGEGTYATTTPTSTPVAILHPPETVPDETLRILATTIVPANDPAELARRLGGVTVIIPDSLPAPAAPFTVGATQTFWGTNTDTNLNFQIEVTLQYVTPHTYFWVENGVVYDPAELSALADDFEARTYPTVREFFGPEWTPGIDNDPHLYIVYAQGIGGGIAGYFSSADEVHPLASEYSNAHEMFFISADNAGLSDTFTYGVLAHEFQHMIHWNGDRNETTWINEGFSELAALLTGYYNGSFDSTYAHNTDLQLNDWPQDGDKTPHYGGAFLFLAYFLDRFGEAATRDLVADPLNGFDSIDHVLTLQGGNDPLRGHSPSGNGVRLADDLFQDFSLALFLQDASVGDGRYTFTGYTAAPEARLTETIRTCPTGPQARDVSQYGIDYIRLTCQGESVLHFEGSTLVPVVPADPHSGDYAFWSNRGDSADMTLTQQFDFTDVTGPLTLSYWLWYDLETDYDYSYLVASTDGETWQIITTPGGTAANPTGSSYGWAYNGESGGWVQESVDLSQFAGGPVWLRFETITDAGTNGAGLLIDDIAIPEIGYATDFEADAGGWAAAGFVRIQNALLQTYRLSLISFTSAGARVEYIELSADNTVDIPISIGGEVDAVVLVVSGTARYTTQRTGYLFEVIDP